MKPTKHLIAIILAGAVCVFGVVGFGVVKAKQIANTFQTSGYVLTAEPDEETKQILFNGGTNWKSMPDSQVAFDDVQGESKSVEDTSFAHYDNNSLSALSDGVVVDLNDVSTSQVTSHYAVGAKVMFDKSGSEYKLGSNTEAEYAFSDFIWKLAEEKYMLISDSINLHFSDEDVREVKGYVEVSYIDGGVVQFQTEENIWQTVSPNCWGVLSNGEVVNFTYRNVQDANGDVLLDFSKIVLNSDDNVEVTPLTPGLMEVVENIIPFFDITAEDGEDAENGTNGTNGDNGTNGNNGTNGENGTNGDNGTNGTNGADGEQGTDGDSGLSGEDGNAGANGAAGTSGTNGAAGSPGAKGNDGNDGGAQKIEGTVLKLPTFTMAVPEGSTAPAWAVTATTCKGNIMVEDPGTMLLANTAELHSEIYLIDLTTGLRINEKNYSGSYQESYFNYNPQEATGYSFEFTGLEPEHSYQLWVSAPFQVDGDSEPYLRSFISKTFWTDSTGVIMEAGKSTESTVSTEISRSYVQDGLTTYVQLFSSKKDAESAVEKNWVECKFGDEDSVTNKWEKLGENALASDSTYYARLAFDLDGNLDNGMEKLGDQIIELKTLKKRPTVGSPILTSNRDSWGFDLTPGQVTDPDHGVVSYTYEFYEEASVNPATGKLWANATPIKTLASDNTAAITVPLDGTDLRSGKTYYVRTVTTFYDNEKEYTFASGFSNSCSVQGSQRPAVYFINEGSTVASNLATAEDQLVGDIYVTAGTNGSKLMVDGSSYIPKVTVQASGYYSVTYPVYPVGKTPIQTGVDSYLLADTSDPSRVKINLPNRATNSSNVIPQGAVNGLKAGLTYEIIVTGSLSEDGVTVKNADKDIEIGRWVIATPESTPVQTEWTTDSDALTATFRFTDGQASGEASQFIREMATMSTLTATLYSGKAPGIGETETGKNLGPVTLSNNDIAAITGDGYTLSLVGMSGDKELSKKYSVVHVTLSDAKDYTSIAANTVYQNGQYLALHDEAYTNTYPLMTPTVEIELGEQPDPLPKNDAPDTMGIFVAEQKDSTYVLTPNYANGAKLAKTITYYVFDAVDYFNDYTNDTVWKLSDTYSGLVAEGKEHGFLTAVTAVENKTDGKGKWLGKVTVPVGASGEMPKVHFVPMTREAFKAANPNAAVDFDSDGNTYLFYTDDSTEPKTGHQFVFAWTMTYQRKLNGQFTGKTEYYPFELSEYIEPVMKKDGSGGAGGYWNIPRSEVMDAPRKMPVVYAMPWNSGKDPDDNSKQQVTWKTYLYDPENAVVGTQDGSTRAALYQKLTATTGTKITKNNVPVTIPIHNKDLTATYQESQVDFLIKGEPGDDNLVTIPKESSVGSVPIAVRVQRYTNKYTTSGDGLFPSGSDTGNSGGYVTGSGDGKWNLKDSSNITVNNEVATFGNAFTYYSEANGEITEAEANGVKFEITSDAAGASRAYNFFVKVTGPYSTMQKVTAVRMTFAKNSQEIVLDKPLYGADGKTGTDIWVKDGDNVTVTFRVSISGELGRTDKVHLDGQEGVVVSAALCYESDNYGYEEVVKKSENTTYSLVSYTGSYLKQDNKGTLKLTKSGNAYFENKTKTNLSYHKDYKLGSVFTMSLSSAESTTVRPVSTLGVQATRAGYYAGKAYTTGIKIYASGVWGTTTENSEVQTNPNTICVPCVLKTQPFGTTTNIDIPAADPQITYNNADVSSNGANVEYALSGTDSIANQKIYFTLEKQEPAGEDSYYYVQQYVSQGVTESQFGTSSAIEYLGDPATYGIGDNKTEIKVYESEGQLSLDGVLNYIASKQQIGGKQYQVFRTVATNLNEVDIRGLSGKTTYLVRAWYWNPDKVWYNPDGSVCCKGGFIPLQMPSTADDSGLVVNKLQIETQQMPDIILKETNYGNPRFSGYTNKYLAYQPSISGVFDYYWTMELQDSNGEFVTWLGVGNSDDKNSQKIQMYDVDGFQNTISSFFANANYWNPGMEGKTDEDYANFKVKTREQYRYERNELTTNGKTGAALPTETSSKQELTLNYGQSYKVQLRVYKNGTGPAYDTSTEGYDFATDKANLLYDEENPDKTAAAVAKTIKEFTVPTGESSATVTPTQEQTNDGIRLVFTPRRVNTTKDSYTIRQELYAPVVIRTYVNDEGDTAYEDVTDKLYYGNKKLSDNNNIGTFDSGTSLYLKLNEQQSTDWSGSTFTCFIYGIRDTVNSGETKAYEKPGRDTILAGRLEGILDKKMVAELKSKNGMALKNDTTGKSVLLASCDVLFRSESVSAGYVKPVWNEKTSTLSISLQNTIKPEMIQKMYLEMTATYTAKDGEQSQSRYQELGEDVEFGSNQDVTIERKITFDIPEGATITGYSMTVYFEADQNSDGELDPVTLYKYTEDNGSVNNSNYHYSCTFEPEVVAVPVPLLTSFFSFSPAPSAPAEPEEPAVNTTSVQAPAENADSTPAETTDTAPAETTDSAPAQTTESAPAQTTESAPAQTTESAPAQTTDSAPAQTTDSAPAQTTESAPAQTTESTQTQDNAASSAEGEAAAEENQTTTSSE